MAGTSTTAHPSQTPPPAHARTLLEVLAWHLQWPPDQTQFVVLADDAQDGSVIRGGRLYPQDVVCAPIPSAGQAGLQAPDLFAAAVTLREASRRAIAGHLDGA